jgi:antirestriction protein ArdC
LLEIHRFPHRHPARHRPLQDVYTRITSKIIASLEQGVRPWIEPWNAEHAAGRITRPLRHNGQAYSGINALALWASAMAQNFTAPIWITYRQATELGAQVRKGEKGSPVVYANSITRTEHDDATGEDTEREIPFLKGYTVFNVEQIDGLPAIYYTKAAPALDSVQRIERTETFVAATRATVRHGGNRAYYAQELDYVQMPPFEAFRDAELLRRDPARACAFDQAPVAPRPRPWPQKLGRCRLCRRGTGRRAGQRIPMCRP